MTNIVERLRGLRHLTVSHTPTLCDEAANEIEALRAQITALETPSASAVEAYVQAFQVDSIDCLPVLDIQACAAVERATLAPYAGMIAVPAPVWEVSGNGANLMFAGLRVTGYSGHKERDVAAIRQELETEFQQTLARLGGNKIGVE